MPVAPVFEKLCAREKTGEIVSQVKAECKTDVPTEIVEKILNENVCATVTLGEVKKGKAEFVGKATFFVCYSAQDGIKKFECGAEIRDALIGDAIEDGDTVKLSFSIDKPEIDLSGLKTAVSAYLTVKGEIFRKKEYPALTGGDGLFCDDLAANTLKHVGAASSVYSVEEEFEVPYCVSEVLCHRAEACVSSVQCGVGTVICDGEIYLSEILLQSGEKSDIIRENKIFPFRAEIACEDAMPQNFASCRVKVRSLKTDVGVDADKNLSNVTVSVSLSLNGEAFSLNEETFAKDAFSIENELTVTKETVKFYAEGEPLSVYEKFTGRVAADGVENAKAVTVMSEKAEIASATVANGEITVTGAATINALFFGEDGKPFSRKAEIPFEHKIPYGGGNRIDVTVTPKRAGVKIVGGTELECEVETVLSVYEEKEYSAEIVSAVEQGEKKAENDAAISVYIPLEGENLWDLAKRLNADPDTLLSTNKDLRFPLTGKERIVVYRRK